MEVHPQYAQTSAQELSTVSTVFSTATSGEKHPDFRGSARSNAFFHTDCGKNFAPPVVNITISSIPVDNFLPIHKRRINSLPLMCRGCRPCELRLPACRGSCQSEGLTEGVYGWTKQKCTDPSEECLPLQGKPFLRSTGPVPPAGACPSRGGAKQGVQRILHRNLKFDAES